MNCKYCGASLTDAQFLLLDNNVYKSCPECSKEQGQHVFYKCPDAFGTTGKRVTQQNPMGLQSYCAPCRSNKTGPHENAIMCKDAVKKGGYIINEIRFLPMSTSVFPTYDDAKQFLIETMPNRGATYYFKHKKMNCPENTFVLFQFEGRLIGYAVYLKTTMLEESVELGEDDYYEGYYQFAENTITVLNAPLTSDDIKSIDPSFKAFGMAQQIKPVGFLPAIFNLMESGKGYIKAEVKECLPEEIEVNIADNLIEGAKKQITVNAYERNSAARNACINYYKKKNDGALKCEICGFNFSDVYGQEFKDKMHVHHIKEISTIGKEYVIDATKDLIPICPNCHMIAHSRKPAYTPTEIKDMLNNK